jgi:hypothetical protein
MHLHPIYKIIQYGGTYCLLECVDNHSSLLNLEKGGDVKYFLLKEKLKCSIVYFRKIIPMYRRLFYFLTSPKNLPKLVSVAHSAFKKIFPTKHKAFNFKRMRLSLSHGTDNLHTPGSHQTNPYSSYFQYSTFILGKKIVLLIMIIAWHV